LGEGIVIKPEDGEIGAGWAEEVVGVNEFRVLGIFVEVEEDIGVTEGADHGIKEL
jgi:hypothetical protein